MNIAKLHPEIEEYLREHKLVKKIEKQTQFFKENMSHPGLNVELLQPRHLKIFSFRVDKKYRAIFVFIRRDTIEIIDINNHYK